MRRHVGGMSLLTDLSLAIRTDPLALVDQRSHGVCDSNLWTSSHICVP